jgi:YegS/Rv2252/BmrU family lipid kinase
MGKQKLLFIFNPKSGLGLIRNHLMDIVDIMVKAKYEVTVYPTQARADAKRKVKEDGAQFDRIVCCGGDGTLDEVVTGLREAELDIPLGYIPAGSTNDFASSIGIPGDMVKAAKIAVGKSVGKFDVGQFNEDTFVYIAAFGMFTEISYETPQELKNVLGHMAYILSAAKSLAAIPNYKLHIESNGRVIDDTFIYGMVTNSTSVAGFKGLPGKNVELSDGEFEVTLIKPPMDPIQLGEIVAYLLDDSVPTKLVTSFKTDHMRVTSKEAIPWTLDGEFGGQHKAVDIQNLCQKVQILIDKKK